MAFWSNAILLICVVAPIALAERTPVYLLAVVLASGLGQLRVIRRRPALLGRRFADVVVLIAFGYLIAEYVVFEVIMVIALSHFLTLVGAVKLLQARTPRDDGQVLVLSLMLLLIGAIVSGNIVFLLALMMVMSLGVCTLVRLHIQAERSRSTGSEFAAVARDSRDEPAEAGLSPGRYARLVGGIGMAGAVVGIAVFLISPRPESGFLRELHSVNAGPVLTGFSSSVDLRGDQNIIPSERAVMRVRVNGRVPLSQQEHESEHYFRGQVSERYGRRVAGLAAGWGWQRRREVGDPYAIIPLEGEAGHAVLGYAKVPYEPIQYQFWLEPGSGDSRLFSPYPILELASHDFSELRMNRRDHTLRVNKQRKVIRYTVTTVPAYAATLVRSRLENESEEAPPLVGPEVPLPRTEEILRLIDREVGAVGPLNVPSNREAFLHRLETYLSSAPFRYSLTLPKVPVGREPIGQFLLESRIGHCEYFASAMAIVCQLKGIQARLVTGYRGGDYNPVGGFLVVREKHAHAWVEAFIPEKGWMVYDPTPGASMVGPPTESWLAPVRTFADFLQFQWANLIVAYDSSSREELIGSFHAWITRPVQDQTTLAGAVVVFVRELFGWRIEMSARDRLLYWVFALLVLMLVVLLGYVLFFVCRWGAGAVGRSWILRRRGGASRADLAFYFRFSRRLAALGIRRPPGQTPAEFADELAARYPALQQAPELIRLYYALAFGGRELTPDHLSWVEEFLQSLRHLDRSSLRASPPRVG